MENLIQKQVPVHLCLVKHVRRTVIKIIDMPINDAIKFIQTLKADKGFREYLYSFGKPEQVQHFIGESGFRFSMQEFYATYNLLLLKCQVEEEASLLNQVCNTYLFILGQEPLSY
jgi:hypothetical protein